MSTLNIRNLDYLRTTSPTTPGYSARLYEAITDLATAHTNLAQQVNGNSTGQPQAPPQINGLKVSALNGHFSAEITDNNPIYRGISYFLEHADNPHFVNPIIEKLGDTRNWHDFLGNTTRYFRAYSSYQSSGPSNPIYHGGAQPLAVRGGGTIGSGPAAAAMGSGTGTAGQGLTGPGIVPFRSTTGAPPVR